MDEKYVTKLEFQAFRDGEFEALRSDVRELQVDVRELQVDVRDDVDCRCVCGAYDVYAIQDSRGD
ncbi:hypothetical protein [Weissella cibaria]|uniref:hypothetical protein n=1 Tax=Weissella cibaria TaxID=137591 RepID=UPI0036D8FC09